MNALDSFMSSGWQVLTRPRSNSIPFPCLRSKKKRVSHENGEEEPSRGKEECEIEWPVHLEENFTSIHKQIRIFCNAARHQPLAIQVGNLCIGCRAFIFNYLLHVIESIAKEISDTLVRCYNEINVLFFQCLAKCLESQDQLSESVRWGIQQIEDWWIDWYDYVLRIMHCITSIKVRIMCGVIETERWKYSTASW